MPEMIGPGQSAMLALVFLLSYPGLFINAQILTIDGHSFYIDGKPFDMWGVRVASATQSDEYTHSLMANLDDYQDAGINSISIYLQGSSGGYTDPFENGGLAIKKDHWKRLQKMIRACSKRDMVVIVGIFYQRTVKNPEISHLRSEQEIRNAVRTVAEKLRPYRHVIINIANEHNSAHYQDFKAFDFNNPENIISLCEEVKKVDPNRMVGGGGYHDDWNVVIGKSEFVDVLLFDTYSKDIENEHHSGWHYDYFREQGVPDKPMVNVELFGGWTRQFMPPGVYTQQGKEIHYREIEAAEERPGLYVHLHSNPWFQGVSQDLPNHFELGGDGTLGNPGVRWYFDEISGPQRSSNIRHGVGGTSSRLTISEDGLRLQKSDGSDWFWLGDTGWSLFQELSREDAEYYFSTRADQGFTVIQAVAIMGWNRDWNDANVYGHQPFDDGDARRPNEDYWQHTDWLIQKAQEYGLYVALLPAWGSYWGHQATLEYAAWISSRYRDYENIIWVNGGDRDLGADRELFSQIGHILDTDQDALCTFHPRGGDHSSKHFHEENWLDFNMQQSSHGERNVRADYQVDLDLGKMPVKPTLNGEPNYEDHCVGWDEECAKGTFNAHDVRQLAYWTVFAGAAGFTYGHVHVWDFDHGGNKEDGYLDWRNEIHDSGAVQMGYLMDLMMSRPHLDRKPAQFILGDSVPAELEQRAVMGNGYAFIYTAQGRNINVQLNEVPWKKKKAWWYNPRNGLTKQIGKIPKHGMHVFNPPGNSGSDNDWILVIDDQRKKYTRPGLIKDEQN